MNRAREMCGRNVTTMTVRHPYCAAKRRSSRPSPFVVGGSGTKQCRSSPGCGAAQKSLSPTWSLAPMRVRHHQAGRPALQTEVEADGVPVATFPAQDEYRVGMPQLIDLWTHVDRQPADHSGDHQNAD